MSSTATGTVVNFNNAPTGSVTITGTAVLGQTLSAANNLSDWDGLGTIGYQWQANGANIGGATASTFTLAEAQVGKTITVVASYTDGHGTLKREQFATVQWPTPTSADRIVTIRYCRPRPILTAANNLADADGLGTIATSGRPTAPHRRATGSARPDQRVGKTITVTPATPRHGTETVSSSVNALPTSTTLMETPHHQRFSKTNR